MTVVFGPFEVRIRTRELLRNGRLLRMPGLPFEILVALLARPGDLVTRDELRQRLWPDGTFVDFDNNLNNAVNRLRQALGDSADAPKYIETLPRLGYRFIGSIARQHDAGEVESTNPPEAAHGAAGSAGVARSSQRASRLLATRLWLLVAATGLLVVALPLAWLTVSTPDARDGGRRRLVVLPLTDLSPGAEPSFLAEGLTEELITELARVDPARLSVIARTTAFRYRGTTKSVAEIARELEVDYIVEGSVRREGGRARVTAQLIEATGESHVWAASYDRDLVDLLAIERDVAAAVATAIRVAVVPERTPPGDRVRSVEARAAYMEARHFYAQGTVAATERALAAYRRAIEIEPNFALAQAGLARSLVFSTRTAPRDALAGARDAAQRALTLDPDLPEARLAWAMVRLYHDRDFDGAEREFRRAIALDAGNPDVHFYHAQLLTAAGRFDEALSAARRAHALDPFSALVHHYIGRILIFARRPNEAIAHLKTTLEMEPNYGWALIFLVAAREQAGHWEEAVEARQDYWEVMGVPATRVGRLGDLYAASGYGAVRREWIDWIKAFADRSGFVTSTELAMHYTALGEDDEAFRWLRRAYDDRTRDLIYLRVYPEFDRLRADPRFEEIVRRVFGPSS